MILIPRSISYYKSRNNKMPFMDWISNLDPSTKEVVYERIEKVKVGYFGDYKNLGDGVFELRINFGSGYRIYYAVNGKDIILLLCAGNKDTQSRDVKKAKFFWEEYKNAKKD
ncbi:MAG: type II toxin-antitoxin system RelE/ParE family toxin [Proteobacteria bacterium]|nr:type II toxin-antitoxin system RelE/ParE family toxin [Pseudomonadota bacterium]